MGRVFKDYTGKTFGKLKAIKRLERPSGSGPYKWLCECLACGRKDCVVHATNLKRAQSCGCGKNPTGEKHHAWAGLGELSATFITTLRNRAIARGKEWSVDIFYLWALYQKQNGKCALSGEPITFPKHRESRRTASLDRIENDKGYIEGNVQWVHVDVNFMKYQLSQNRLIELCNKISENKRGHKLQSDNGISYCI